MKFKYFFLITALISSQSQAMFKKDLLSLFRSRDKTKIMFELHEKRRNSVELDGYGNTIELEKYIALEEYHEHTTHHNKKTPKKLTRTLSSTIESV